jgi:DNA invertase Pin-like site-specific DNA recombinase
LTAFRGAEPFLDVMSGFAAIIFAILGMAAKLERHRILEQTASGRAEARDRRDHRRSRWIRQDERQLIT